MNVTNFNLNNLTTFDHYVDHSQMCLATAPASVMAGEISAKNLPKQPDPFYLLNKIDRNSLLKSVISFKIEKLSLFPERAFNSRNSFEYISFPFDQPYDRRWIQEVDKAIDAHSSFITKVAQGISTTYLIRDGKGKKIALFKPDDKASPHLDNEQSALREHLAWVIGKELVEMPESYVVEINVNGKPTLGSLQKFVDSEGNLKEVAAGHWRIKQLAEKLTQDRLPWISDKEHEMNQLGEIIQASKKAGLEILSDYPSQTRGIALLDILIQNWDRRNPQNTLIKKEECGYRLIPIDHNLAFPENIENMAWFSHAHWFDSSAVKQPFSDREIQWLNELDIEAVKEMLLNKGLDRQRVNAFGIMAELVQVGARAGLTLLDITTLIINLLSTSNPSPLLKTMKKIQKETNSENMSEEVRKQIHSMVMEKRDEIAQFGKTDIKVLQEKTNELMDDKIGLIKFTTSIEADVCLPLSIDRQAIHDLYVKEMACPKEYLEPRFNITRPGKPLKVSF